MISDDKKLPINNFRCGAFLDTEIGSYLQKKG